MIYLFNDFINFTHETFNEFLNTIPESRKQEVIKYKFEKDQKLCLIAYKLLQYGLFNRTHIKSIPEFYYGEHGKPYLKNNEDYFFNFSHCSLGVVCALTSHEVGIDIQDLAEFNYYKSNLIISEDELNLINSSSKPNETFTTLWTLKESYLKCIGTGITNSLSSIDFSDFNYPHFTKYGYFFTIFNFDNVFISCCTNKEDYIENVTISDLYTFYI